MEMRLPIDFKEFLKLLNDQKARSVSRKVAKLAKKTI